MSDESTTMQDAMEAIQDNVPAMIAVEMHVIYMMKNHLKAEGVFDNLEAREFSAAWGKYMARVWPEGPDAMYAYLKEVDWFGDPGFKEEGMRRWKGLVAQRSWRAALN
jgi:hypothetical protein